MPEARIAIHNLHSRTGPARQLAESGASVLLLCETRPLLVQAALRRRLGQGWEHRTRDAISVWWDSTVWAPYRLRFLPLLEASSTRKQLSSSAPISLRTL